uniref:Outer membrane protein beta-barrel domain-containing protein n=1 Tax=candidate division WOR-3 bacterium TaxID=2052148 RepID=A0A7C2P2U0_UNCW3
MKRILFLLPLLFLNGCFLGTFRSAEPIGAGNVEKSVYFNLPLYYSTDYRDNAKTSGSYYSRANLGAMVIFGASEYLDFGLRYDFAEGLGPQMKFRFLHVPPFSLAFASGFGYNFFAQGFSWDVELLGSAMISHYSSLYLGFLAHHAPDYRNLAKISDYFDVKRFNNFFGVAMGISFRNFEAIKFPSGMNMEIVVPIDKYPPIIWGFNFAF